MNLPRDAIELQDYYDRSYGSETYKNLCIEHTDRHLKRLEAVSKEYTYLKKKENLLKLLISVIYLMIFVSIIFYPCVIVLIILFHIFRIQRKASCTQLENFRQDTVNAENAEKEANEKIQEFIESVEKPNVPAGVYLSKEGMEILLEIFHSGRAENYKEACIIRSQDYQHEQLMDKQEKMRKEIDSARAQAAAAMQAAVNARHDAENARREARNAKSRADDSYYRRW